MSKRDQRKSNQSWGYVRTVAPYLEPGERPGVVVFGQVGLDVRWMGVVCLAAIFLLFPLFPETDSSRLTGTALHHANHVDDLRLFWTFVVMTAYLVALISLFRPRWFVLTNCRLLVMGGGYWNKTLPRKLLGADPIEDVRVDMVRRSLFSYSFGIRTKDGRTTRVLAQRRWLPEIETLASSLDSGVVAPSRPDAVRMKEGSWLRRLMAVTMVAVVAATVFGAAASAGTGRPRTYEGPLGDGSASIHFELLKREGRPLAMRSFGFGIVSLTCDVDGSVQEWGVEFGWGGRLPELPSHLIDFDVVEPDSAIHLHGKVQAVHGEGTLVLTIPALTVDEHAQVCATGELPWTVDRTVPPVLNPAPTPVPIQVLHFVTADGAHVTLTRVS